MSSIDSTSSSTSSLLGGGNTLRITGMASGLDVDSIVKKLMAAESVKVDKENQKLQTLQWKQSAYRDTINDLNTFKSTYFDILNKDSYMLSSKNYTGFNVNSSDSTTATASALLGAVPGNYSLLVSQIADSAKISGSSLNSQVEVKDVSNWQGKAISFNINGVSTAININAAIPITADTLTSEINREISSSAALNGKISASSITDSEGKTYIKFIPLTADNIQIDPVTTLTTVSDFTNTSSIRLVNINNSTKLSDLGVSGSQNLSFTYNGSSTPINITLDNNDGSKKVGDLISAINTATSGNVTASFDDLTGKFTLKTLATGSSSLLNITGGSLQSSLGLGTTTLTAQGVDAKVKITSPDGNSNTFTEAKNNFTINNVNYNLIKQSSSTTNITVSSNPQAAFDKIKAFIDKYNDAISKINTKLNEKKDYSYTPLTSTQKSAMTTDQITQWETKAKTGILANDTTLENMLTNMRMAFYTSVKGTGISLSDIGLSTSTDITQGGKIIIDETKLKDAITNQGDKVAALFSQQSSTQPLYSPDLTSAQRSNRNSEEGIFQRINDLLQDNIGTMRNSSGRKGTLLEQAGIKGDFTEFNNSLSTQITEENKAITDLNSKLSDKQTAYYNQYAKLETAMQKLNSQSSWISQMLGTSSSS